MASRKRQTVIFFEHTKLKTTSAQTLRVKCQRTFFRFLSNFWSIFERFLTKFLIDFRATFWAIFTDFWLIFRAISSNFFKTTKTLYWDFSGLENREQIVSCEQAVVYFYFRVAWFGGREPCPHLSWVFWLFYRANFAACAAWPSCQFFAVKVPRDCQLLVD